MKAQCMHCVDPACVSACMLGAFKKREFGIVTYDVDYCIGCRYCEVACPFNVPKFEWAKAAPKMVKCELCNHRLAAGKEPACTEVCPRQAVIFGKRERPARARRTARLAEQPGQLRPEGLRRERRRRHAVLYLSHVPFEKLGLPALGERVDAVAAADDPARHLQGLRRARSRSTALLGAVMFRNRRHRKGSRRHERARQAQPVGGRILTRPFRVLAALFARRRAADPLAPRRRPRPDHRDERRLSVGPVDRLRRRHRHRAGLRRLRRRAARLHPQQGQVSPAGAPGGADQRARLHAGRRSASASTSAAGGTSGTCRSTSGTGTSNSVLLEVALCIMSYMFVLWIELSPAFLEKAGADRHRRG